MRPTRVGLVVAMLCVSFAARGRTAIYGCARERNAHATADPAADGGAAAAVGHGAGAAMPSAAASFSSVGDASPSDAATIVLPKIETACAVDADCAVTSLDLAGPTTCCFRCCSITPGTKRWVTVVEATCAKAAPTCPPMVCACPMPPFKPKCAAGKCIATY